MEGFGNKSTISGVATVDFSEGAVGVYSSLKNRKNPSEFYFSFCILTLTRAELPGRTLGGARTVVCQEIQ